MISGIGTSINFATDIFNETGGSFDPIDGTITITVVQVVANAIVFKIVDRFNRRPLYAITSFFTMIAFIWFALYAHFFKNNPAYEWMGVASLGLSIFIGCLGLYPVPYIVCVEIIPRKVQIFGMTAIMTWMMLCIFVTNTAFPFLKDLYGLPVIFVGFAVLTLINMFFAIFGLPETRGKSNAEIMKILEK